MYLGRNNDCRLRWFWAFAGAQAQTSPESIIKYTERKVLVNITMCPGKITRKYSNLVTDWHNYEFFLNIIRKFTMRLVNFTIPEWEKFPCCMVKFIGFKNYYNLLIYHHKLIILIIHHHNITINLMHGWLTKIRISIICIDFYI